MKALKDSKIVSPTDVEILESSYEKYKDKTGGKAVALKMRIDGFKAWDSILKRTKNQTNHPITP